MTDPRNAYLETQISTATPQKLRLMLIEGGIRKAQAVCDHWEHGRQEDGLQSLHHCQAIAQELYAGIRDDGSPLVQQVFAIYGFVIKELIEAELDLDAARVTGVLNVLQEERQTWQELCQTMPEAPVARDSYSATSQEVVAPQRVDAGNYSTGYFAPHMSSSFAPTASSGFSLEG
ncbi:Flagellar protein FliS [Anatilimnocola aggregata]|uniref:Flagellar protein FliS n=1 Tax=Anatilimnocola aggregata TaxID=2528021 RepID=A0A517YLA5_9BACT|nr:flagellar export chaperone FliS [Anatilimnocola aggregata]QDU30988.1 Flagellar protein FliS [Anatilimnocola aggregata]